MAAFSLVVIPGLFQVCTVAVLFNSSVTRHPQATGRCFTFAHDAQRSTRVCPMLPCSQWNVRVAAADAADAGQQLALGVGSHQSGATASAGRRSADWQTEAMLLCRGLVPCSRAMSRQLDKKTNDMVNRTKELIGLGLCVNCVVRTPDGHQRSFIAGQVVSGLLWL